MNAIDKLKSKLESRVDNKIYRSLRQNGNLTDFTSNDYLGLARSKKLFEAIQAAETPEPYSGATGSRLLSGHSSLYEKTEKYLDQIFLAEKVLIFNSGYNANLGILSAVPGKGDTIIYDELIHASLKDGARLSMAQHLTFKHNDLDHLEKKIRISKGNVFVIAESIYSMNGDACPLNELLIVCEKYGAEIILDEAHSTGIIGEKGSGLACSMGLQDRILARIYTFGKAMGIHGACIAGSATLIDFLVNFSRPFIYTTALPPHAVHSIHEAFMYLSDHQELQEILKDKITRFKKLMNSAGIKGLIPSDSAIQALVIMKPNIALEKNRSDLNASDMKGGEISKLQKNLTIALAGKVQKRGFDVRPILSPTVREGTERIRICLHVHNTDLEIEKLVRAIKEGLEEL